MEALLFTYLRTGFFASVMILAVLLLRPLLHKAPRNISCVLWLLVILRLLVPFQLESPLSLQPRQLTQTHKVTVEVTVDSVPEVTSPPATVPTTSLEPITYQLETLPNETNTVYILIWFAGILAVILYAIISYGVLRHRIRDAVKCPEGVWESDRIGGAFLLGYFKPRIYIPTELNLKDRRFILAHERSHLKRGDHWWKLLGMICLSIHWYNPLVWLSYALLCRDIEVACDERVIRDLKLEERKSYSFALLNSGKLLSGFLTYPVAFGEVSLKTRIKKVLNYHKPSLWITLGSITVAVAIAVCFMTNPANANTAQSEENPGAVQTTQPTTEAPTAPTTEVTEPETQPPAETTAPAEPVTEPPAETTAPTEPPTTVPTEPKPTQPKPTEPEPTQPTVKKPATPEPSTPSVTIPADFAEKLPTVTLPQRPSLEQTDSEEAEDENQNNDHTTGGISLIPKEPVKTGVELPQVPIFEDISPKPSYPPYP